MLIFIMLILVISAGIGVVSAFTYCEFVACKKNLIGSAFLLFSLSSILGIIFCVILIGRGV